MLNGQRISIISGCRDRESFLLQSLPTWLASPEIDEVVVVDWSSISPLEDALKPYLHDTRLVIAVGSNQPRWHLTKCCNLGLLVSTGDLILRLDSDVLLDRRFFADNPIEKGSFRGGYDLKILPHPPGLWGVMFAFKEDILRVNAYNERLVGYGWDDEDLFLRMATSGIDRGLIQYKHLKHLDHGPNLRLGTQSESLEVTNNRNQKLSLEFPWTSRDCRTKWELLRFGQIVRCAEVA
jgi:hypothetical protein